MSDLRLSFVKVWQWFCRITALRVIVRIVGRGDLRSSDTRIVPFELAIMEIVWSPAWKLMKPWGDILG